MRREAYILCYCVSLKFEDERLCSFPVNTKVVVDDLAEKTVSALSRNQLLWFPLPHPSLTSCSYPHSSVVVG